MQKPLEFRSRVYICMYGIRTRSSLCLQMHLIVQSYQQEQCWLASSRCSFSFLWPWMTSNNVYGTDAVIQKWPVTFQNLAALKGLTYVIFHKYNIREKNLYGVRYCMGCSQYHQLSQPEIVLSSISGRYPTESPGVTPSSYRHRTITWPTKGRDLAWLELIWMSLDYRYGRRGTFHRLFMGSCSNFIKLNVVIT